jgi:hypothetical protein
VRQVDVRQVDVRQVGVRRVGERRIGVHRVGSDPSNAWDPWRQEAAGLVAGLPSVHRELLAKEAREASPPACPAAAWAVAVEMKGRVAASAAPAIYRAAVRAVPRASCARNAPTKPGDPSLKGRLSGLKGRLPGRMVRRDASRAMAGPARTIHLCGNPYDRHDSNRCTFALPPGFGLQIG